MLTANTSKPLSEELEYLANAVEGDTFHFVVAQWNHFSAVQRTKDYLRQHFPERSSLSLTVKDETYESLIERICQQQSGFVFLDDFENLLDEKNKPGIAVGFNQRRGKVARLPLTIVAFIPPGERFVEQCMKQIPDWWSVLTFLATLDLPMPFENEKTIFSPLQDRAFVSTLGGNNQPDRLAEITRLKARIGTIEAKPENTKLLDELYTQALQLCDTAGLYQLGLDIANDWLRIALSLDYEQIAPDMYAQVLDRIGTFERYLGHYDRAARHIEMALELDLKNFGAEHPTVAAIQSNLSLVYQDLGEYTRARDLLESALQSSLKNLGTEHPAIAIIQSNLANVYKDLGEYVRARDLLESALQNDLKNFSPEHPNVTARQSNLANVYSDLGEYIRARDLLESALQSDLKNFGSEHPNVAISQSNLASVYADLGEYARARDLSESALQSDLKNFGPEHPAIALRQSNLATIYSHLGEYTHSRSLLELALQNAVKNFGEAHPNVAVNQSNLASVYAAEGRWSEALPLFRQAHANFLKNLGEQHPHAKLLKQLVERAEQKVAAS